MIVEWRDSYYPTLTPSPPCTSTTCEFYPINIFGTGIKYIRRGNGIGRILNFSLLLSPWLPPPPPPRPSYRSNNLCWNLEVARNRVGIGLSYRHARLHMLAPLIFRRRSYLILIINLKQGAQLFNISRPNKQMYFMANRFLRGLL
jgi:hypothetical protein